MLKSRIWSAVPKQYGQLVSIFTFNDRMNWARNPVEVGLSRDVARNLPREGWMPKTARISRIKGQTLTLRERPKGKRFEIKGQKS